MDKVLTVLLVFGFQVVFAQDKDKLDPVGFWQGGTEGDVGYIELSESGHATFIFGKDTMGGPNGQFGGQRAQLQYRINYKTIPWQIDFVAVRQSDLTEVGVMKGLFAMYSKEIMNLCVNFEGDTRPKSLTSPECMTFFRVPPPPRKRNHEKKF